MKSIRLNKETRLQIASAIMEAYKAKNPVPAGKLPSDVKEELTEAVKAAYLKQSDAVMKKAVEAGIEKYLKLTSSCRYAINGSVYNYLEFSDKVVVLNSESSVWLDVATTKIPAIKKAYEIYQHDIKDTKPIVDAHKAWELAKDNYRTNVWNILEGVNTSKQLLEVWPECERFIPKGIVDPSKLLLPTVNLATLNSKI